MGLRFLPPKITDLITITTLVMTRIGEAAKGWKHTIQKPYGKQGNLRKYTDNSYCLWDSTLSHKIM